MVHLHSRNIDRILARGMSWSVRSSSVAAAFASRPEPEIWLELAKFDHIKEWATGKVSDQSPVELFSTSYSGRRVERKVDDMKRGVSATPAWFGMDDPPLLHAHVYSLPASIMRTTGLTKDRTAQVFADVVATALRNTSPITAHDWHLSVWLDAPAKHLISRLCDRVIWRGPTNILQEWRIAINPSDDEGGVGNLALPG
jgi:hypothetical protein